MTSFEIPSSDGGMSDLRFGPMRMADDTVHLHASTVAVRRNEDGTYTQPDPAVVALVIDTHTACANPMCNDPHVDNLPPILMTVHSAGLLISQIYATVNAFLPEHLTALQQGVQDGDEDMVRLIQMWKSSDATQG